MAAFTPPPSAPQRGDRATFASRVDAFLTWLVNLIPQLNTFVAGLNARDLGGANTFVYTFDSAIDDADPGPGRIRLDSAAQNTANVLRIDDVSANEVNLSAFFGDLNLVTSNVKGSLRLQKVSDPAAWMILDISDAPAGSGGGYRNLDITVRSASSTSPFLNGDSLAVFIDRNGDKGDSGGTPTSQQIRDAVGTMPIANGGTGSTTASGARANLGAMAANAAVVLRGVKNLTASTSFASSSLGSINSLGQSAAAWRGQAPLVISNDGNTNASSLIMFDRVGQYTAYFGLDTDNKWKVGGWNMGDVAHELFHQGNFNPANYAQLSGAAFWGTVSAPNIVNTSDERKKENWRPITDEQLDALADLDLVGLFDWRDGSGSAFGGSAQKIRDIFPDAIFEDEAGVLGIDYGGLTFAIVQAQLRSAKQGRTK